MNGVFLHWEARQWTFLLAGNKEALRPAVITGSLGPSLNVSWSLVMSRDLVEGLSTEPNQCRPESEPLKPSHPREPILLGVGGGGPWFQQDSVGFGFLISPHIRSTQAWQVMHQAEHYSESEDLPTWLRY